MHMYREPRTGNNAADPVLTHTFTLAVLLSGGFDRAEAAMLEAIQQIDAERCCDRELRQLSLRAAIRAGREDATEGPPGFPVELTRVLRLPAGLRECFVLRVLAGLSSEECADLNVFQADEGACAAARELGKMRSSESCGGSIPHDTGFPACVAC